MNTRRGARGQVHQSVAERQLVEAIKAMQMTEAEAHAHLGCHGCPKCSGFVREDVYGCIKCDNCGLELWAPAPNGADQGDYRLNGDRGMKSIMDGTKYIGGWI